MTDSGDAVRFLFIAGRSMRFLSVKTGHVNGRVVLAIGVTPVHKTVPGKLVTIRRGGVRLGKRRQKTILFIPFLARERSRGSFARI